jgi:hypothetical protein
VQLCAKKRKQWAAEAAMRIQKLGKALDRLKQRNAALEDASKRLNGAAFLVNHRLVEDLRETGRCGAEDIRGKLRHANAVCSTAVSVHCSSNRPHVIAWIAVVE